VVEFAWWLYQGFSCCIVTSGNKNGFYPCQLVIEGACVLGGQATKWPLATQAPDTLIHRQNIFQDIKPLENLMSCVKSGT
jgi:hypothetical protein